VLPLLRLFNTVAVLPWPRRFDAMGRIAEIHHHLDADVGEFLDA
jgi:hypothetical protein